MRDRSSQNRMSQFEEVPAVGPPESQGMLVRSGTSLKSLVDLVAFVGQCLQLLDEDRYVSGASIEHLDSSL